MSGFCSIISIYFIMLNFWLQNIISFCKLIIYIIINKLFNFIIYNYSSIIYRPAGCVTDWLGHTRYQLTRCNDMTPNRYLLFIPFITVKLEAKISSHFVVLFHLDCNCMIVGAHCNHAISSNLYVNCVARQNLGHGPWPWPYQLWL